MGKKKRSSASRKKQTPSTTTDEASRPQRKAFELVDMEVKDAIRQVVFAMTVLKDDILALKLIKKSVSKNPNSGHLLHNQGLLQMTMANKYIKDSDAHRKHMNDALSSFESAVMLLPDSLYCASSLASLVYHMANYNQDWERVIELCNRVLKIDHPTTPVAVEDLFGEYQWDELRIEEEKLDVTWWLHVAERKNLEVEAKKALKAKFNIEEDDEVDIKKVVAAMDESKKELREIMRHCTELKLTANSDRKMKPKDTDQEDTISKYKGFWNNKLSDEKKSGFREVNIEELEDHFKSLKCRSAVDLLREAVDFRKKHKTWKFWECCACVEKFGDYESYKEHIRVVHLKILDLVANSSKEIGKELIDMIVKAVWRPVDTDALANLLISSTANQRILNKGLDKCTSSSVEDVNRKICKPDDKSVNMSSKILVVDQTLVFSDDIDRIQILGEIQGMFNLLLENKCLAYSQVSCVIKYAKYQFGRTNPLLKSMNLDNLQILWFLGASKLKKVHRILKIVAKTCGLSENVETDKLSDVQVGGFKESVRLSLDLSSLLLDDLADDGSSESFAADKCQDDLLPDSDDVVSWLHTGSDCEADLVSWRSLRHSQREQAEKFFREFDEQLSFQLQFSIRNGEILSELEEISEAESRIHEEIIMRETGAELELQVLVNIFEKWLKKLQKVKDYFIKDESSKASKLLERAQGQMKIFLGKAHGHGHLNGDQSGSEDFLKDNEFRRLEGIKMADDRIKTASHKLDIFVTKVLALYDGIFLRSVGAFGQYELELASISVYDYQSIIMPMLKSFLQARLKSLYEDDMAERKREEKKNKTKN